MAVKKIGKKSSKKQDTRTPVQNPAAGRVIQASGGKGAMATQVTASADTAVKLLNDIKHKRIDPTTLSPDQRRACLLLMANGTQTSAEMAALFGVSASAVRKDLKKIREELGREVKQFSLEEVLGDLAMTADKCSSQAMRQEDPGLSWTIKRDFAKLLKEFGVVGPREDRNSLSITLQGIGEGYERAREALVKGLDPRLTGEEITVEGKVLEDGPNPVGQAPLPLDRSVRDLSAEADHDQDHDDDPEDPDHDSLQADDDYVIPDLPRVNVYDDDLPDELPDDLEDLPD